MALYLKTQDLIDYLRALRTNIFSSIVSNVFANSKPVIFYFLSGLWPVRYSLAVIT